MATRISPDIRAKARRLYEEQALGIDKIARCLSIAPMSVYRWAKAEQWDGFGARKRGRQRREKQLSLPPVMPASRMRTRPALKPGVYSQPGMVQDGAIQALRRAADAAGELLVLLLGRIETTQLPPGIGSTITQACVRARCGAQVCVAVQDRATAGRIERLLVTRLMEDTLVDRVAWTPGLIELSTGRLRVEPVRQLWDGDDGLQS